MTGAVSIINYEFTYVVIKAIRINFTLWTESPEHKEFKHYPQDYKDSKQQSSCLKIQEVWF